MADLREDAKWHPFERDDEGHETTAMHSCCRQALAAEPTESLDAAWAAAEAALEAWRPEGRDGYPNALYGLRIYDFRGEGTGYAEGESRVHVEVVDSLSSSWKSLVHVTGPTAAAALNALSQALRSEQDK